MLKRIIALLTAFTLLYSGFAYAQIVNTLPYNLTNGSLADATQVMANFNQIVNNTNANAATNGANSDITSLSGLTTPLALAYGGSAYYLGGVSTGSANAQVVATTTPGNFALTQGSLVAMVAGYTNTGSLQLNVNSTGLATVKNSTGVALNGGEVQSGELYVFEVVGSNYQILNPSMGFDGTNFVISSSGNIAFGSAPVLPAGTSTSTPGVNTRNTLLATTTFANPAAGVATGGYQEFPSGIILQWGNFTSSGSAGGAVAVTFPEQFPNATWQITLSGDNASTSATSAWWDTATKSGFNGHSNGVSIGVSYFAVGD